VQDYAYGPSLLNLYGPRGRAPDPGALMLAAVEVHMAARALPGQTAADSLLNAREIEVLRLAAIGRTEQETAHSLSLSRRGVQFHLARAMEKLGAANKTAAVATAVSAGLIGL
jgi:DNA-binding CsgD family transcriptional regulator